MMNYTVRIKEIMKDKKIWKKGNDINSDTIKSVQEELNNIEESSREIIQEIIERYLESNSIGKLFDIAMQVINIILVMGTLVATLFQHDNLLILFIEILIIYSIAVAVLYCLLIYNTQKNNRKLLTILLAIKRQKIVCKKSK